MVTIVGPDLGKQSLRIPIRNGVLHKHPNFYLFTGLTTRVNLFVERLLSYPDDAFLFDAKMLLNVSSYRSPRAMILQLPLSYLWSPVTQISLLIVFQFTNVLFFFFLTTADFESEVK